MDKRGLTVIRLLGCLCGLTLTVAAPFLLSEDIFNLFGGGSGPGPGCFDHVTSSPSATSSPFSPSPLSSAHSSPALLRYAPSLHYCEDFELSGPPSPQPLARTPPPSHKVNVRPAKTPPEGYLCHLCFQTGHFIKDCKLVSLQSVFVSQSLGIGW